MSTNALKAQIKSGEFDKWYIFYVEEPAIAKVYIRKMAERLSSSIVYADSLVDIYSKARQKSLVKSKHLYVVLNDGEFLKNDKMWSALGDGRELKGDTVIFYYTDKDARLKFWKNFKERAVEFLPLEHRLLIAHIQKESGLSAKGAELLADVCENDYTRILNEMDKLFRYILSAESLGCDMSWDEALYQLIEEGVIYKAPKDAIFDFVAAVMDRKPKKALNLLEQSKAVGEANMVLLTVLYNNFRALLQLQTCHSNDVSKSTGLTGFQIKIAKPFIDRYTSKELYDAIQLLRDLEFGIKTGRYADEHTVEYFMTRVM